MSPRFHILGAYPHLALRLLFAAMLSCTLAGCAAAARTTIKPASTALSRTTTTTEIDAAPAPVAPSRVVEIEIVNPPRK